jgi:molybdopterin/thiamine biosynthesis adenylyltransferase
VRTWLDLYPDRVAFEVAELAKLGFEVDPVERRAHHRLVLRGQIDVGGRAVALVISYPDTFPFLRPDVFAPELRLERHFNPYHYNLCLLDRSSAAWRASDTGAWLIRERVPHLLALLEQGGDALRAGEAPQGEPISTYFPARPGTVVFVPAAASNIDPAERSGRFELALARGESAGPLVRALLKTVSVKAGRHGRILAAADEPLERRFAGGPSLTGCWARLDRLPSKNTAEALVAAITAATPEATRPRFQSLGGGQVAVVGCVFSEEVGQGRFEDSWLFVVLHRRMTGAHSEQRGLVLVHGDRLSRDDLAARTPALRGLDDKRVAVLGLGGLGAPIAVDLARAGVGELALLDGDTVEVGNTVRWAFGLSAVGHRKTEALSSWIAAEHPYTRVHYWDGHLGIPARTTDLGEPRERSEIDILDELLTDVDLVIDATAELGVQQLIDTVAAEKPRIFAWATEGAAGGVVARLYPGAACWMCLQHALDDGTVALPPADEQATVQPRGCASTTFTGAAFDLAPVSNQAVRVASATLLGTSPREHDLSILSLRGPAGTPLAAPTWQSQPMEAHPRCVACAVERAA